jgi:hypothetical protein
MRLGNKTGTDHCNVQLLLGHGCTLESCQKRLVPSQCITAPPKETVILSEVEGLWKPHSCLPQGFFDYAETASEVSVRSG